MTGFDIFDEAQSAWQKRNKQVAKTRKTAANIKKEYVGFASRAISSPALGDVLKKLREKAKKGDTDAKMRFNAIQSLRGRDTLGFGKSKKEQTLKSLVAPKSRTERVNRRVSADRASRNEQQYVAPKGSGIGAAAKALTEEYNYVGRFLGRQAATLTGQDELAAFEKTRAVRDKARNLIWERVKEGKISEKTASNLLGKIDLEEDTALKDVRQAGIEADPTRFAASGALIATDLLTGGTGSKVLKEGFKQGAKVTAKAAGIGALQGGLGAFQQDRAPTQEEILTGAGIGAVAGGVLGSLVDTPKVLRGKLDTNPEVAPIINNAITDPARMLPDGTVSKSNRIAEINREIAQLRANPNIVVEPRKTMRNLGTPTPEQRFTGGRLTKSGTLDKRSKNVGTVAAEPIPKMKTQAPAIRALVREKRRLMQEIEQIKNPVAQLGEATEVIDSDLAQATLRGDKQAVETLVKDRKYLTQQTDQAIKQQEVEAMLSPTGGVGPLPGNQKASGQAINIEAQAINKGLQDRGLEDVATYGSTSWSSQGEAAAKILDADYEAAKRIAFGQQDAPEGVLNNAVVEAVKNRALKEGDVDTIQKIVTSNVTAPRTSRYAQELGVLGARDPESPVVALETVMKARKEATPNIPVAISKEETARVTALAKDVATLKEKALREGATRADREAYGMARVRMDNYVETLVAEAKKPLRQAVKDDGLVKVGKDAFTTVAGLSKSAVATLDNSVLLRQGWKTLWTSPKVWAKNSLQSFRDIVKTYKGQEVLDYVHADAISRDNALNGMYKKMKLDVYGAKPTFLEEAFPVTFNKITKSPTGERLLRPFKASDVAFSAWQQRTRLDLADQYLKLAQDQGVDLTKKANAQAIGRIVNSLTGRGNLRKLERVADDMNKVFFAPRLVKSHLDVLGGQILTAAGAEDKIARQFIRKTAAKNLLKIAVGSATVLQLAAAVTGGKVETDPRSSDFGKLRVGNTRYDLSGGMAGLLTLGARVLTQSSKNSTTGEITQLNSGEPFSPTGGDVLLSFAENKLSPLFRAAVDVYKGEDFDGNKPTVESVVKSLTVPLIVQNYMDLKDNKDANIPAMMIAEALGIGSNNYSGLDSNWNSNNSKRVTGFKKKVSEEKFKEANTKFNEEFNDWYTQISADKKFWKLPQDKRETLVTTKKNDITDQVLKSYGYEYKTKRNDSANKLADELLKRYR